MGSNQETNRLQQRIDQFLSQRITRRTAIALALGGAAVAVGCGSSNDESGIAVNPLSSPTSAPEQTPKKEDTTNQLQFIPFEILDHFPQDPELYGIPTPQEGMRWVIVKTGIQNLTDKPLELTKQFMDTYTRKTTLTTAEGYEYPIDSYYGPATPKGSDVNPIQIPPGFRFRSIQANPVYNISPDCNCTTDKILLDVTEDDSGGLDISISNYIFQVPQNATGLKLNITGYEPIDLGKIEPFTGFDPNSNFENAMGKKVLTSDGKVEVEIKDFTKLDNPQSVIETIQGQEALLGEYNFFAVTLNYTNLDQGNVSAGKLRMYSIDNYGNVFQIFAHGNSNDEWYYGLIGFDEIGPGFSKDLTLYLAYPKSAKDVKFVLQGQELGVFNAPLS